jgi:TPR repeat protein
MFALGAVFAGGRDVPVDRQIAQRWFRAAAELGHGHAQMMLGRYLMNGAAGDLNPVEGRMWLERAVAQGVADAEHDLAAAPATRTPAA